jgi:type IV secretion system protein VirB8
MTDQTIHDRTAYYAQGESWAQDINGALRGSRRRAYFVAGIATAIAALEALGLFALAPLKTVVPYTITVDRQTGYIQAAQGVQPGPLSQDNAVIQAFLAQYVLARESFDVTDLQAEYDKVAAWTVGPAREDYLHVMQRQNAESPVNVNDAAALVKVTVKGISLLNRNSALVRFDTDKQEKGSTAIARRSFAAVISFRFTGAAMRNEDRFVNPLGFQVSSYRRDSETPQTAMTSQVSP